MSQDFLSTDGVFVVVICLPRGSDVSRQEIQTCHHHLHHNSVILKCTNLSCIVIVQNLQCETRSLFEKLSNFSSYGSEELTQESNNQGTKCCMLDCTLTRNIPIQETQCSFLWKLYENLPTNQKQIFDYEEKSSGTSIIPAILEHQKTYKKVNGSYCCVSGKSCNECHMKLNKSSSAPSSVTQFGFLEKTVVKVDISGGKIYSVKKGKSINKKSVNKCNMVVSSNRQGRSPGIMHPISARFPSPVQKRYMSVKSGAFSEKQQTKNTLVNDAHHEDKTDNFHLEASVRFGNKDSKHVLYGDIHFTDDERDLSSDEESSIEATDFFSERPPDISLKELKDGTNTKDSKVQRESDKLDEKDAFKVGKLLKTKKQKPTKSSSRKASINKSTNCQSHPTKQRSRVLIVPLRHFLVYSGRRRPGSRRRQQIRDANRMQQSDEYQRNIPMQDPLTPEQPSVNNIVTSTVSIFNRFKDRTSVPTTTATRSMSHEQMQISRILGVNPGLRHYGRPTNPPRHPQYRLEQARRDTFLNWPEIGDITVDDMVSAGFFCVGRDDLVRCFHCGIGLQDWSAGDVPVLEHVRHSHNCGFLADSLQPELLAEYIAELNISFGTELARAPQGAELPLQTPPRNPEYATQALRLASFNNPDWPSTVTQTPQKLSDAGFFFTGTGDLCRCFHCDGGLQNWAPEDDPWVAHARSFPTCRFVVNAKGQAFVVQALQERLHPASSGDDAAGAAANQTSSNIGMVAAQAVRVAVDAGFDKADVDRAQDLLVAEGKTNFTAEELIDQILRSQIS